MARDARSIVTAYKTSATHSLATAQQDACQAGWEPNASSLAAMAAMVWIAKKHADGARMTQSVTTSLAFVPRNQYPHQETTQMRMMQGLLFAK